MPGEGAYLTFDPVSGGTLFIHWSKEEVRGALLYAVPKKNVPAFKYKGNPKSEIVRDLQTDKKKWYRGCCEFVKAVKIYDSDLEVLPEIETAQLPTRIVCKTVGSEDIKRICVTSDKCPTESLTAVAAIPRDSSDLDAKTMTMDLFVQKGVAKGHAIAF